MCVIVDDDDDDDDDDMKNTGINQEMYLQEEQCLLKTQFCSTLSVWSYFLEENILMNDDEESKYE